MKPKKQEGYILIEDEPIEIMSLQKVRIGKKIYFVPKKIIRRTKQGEVVGILKNIKEEK